MQKSWMNVAVLGCTLLAITGTHAHAQSQAMSDSSTVTETTTKPTAKPGASSGELGKIGVGVKVSLLGGGVEVATPVTHRSNVRAGFNMISYSRNFDKDGISYAGQVGFKTIEAHYDIFPFAGRFHISPGLLTYIGDPVTANASVPANQNFTLGNQSYYSDSASPVTGKGKINFNRAAPMFTVGWGNLVSRRESSHFTVPFEIGVAFQGSPKASLNLAGNVCDSPGVNCRAAATDSGVQQQIVAEQTKINNSMSFFKVYPIISVGFGYKF
jgi:hypothetical protein